MKSPFAGNLMPNEVVTTQFLVLSKEIRHKKTGEPYLSLHLADRTGEVDAKMWDNVPEVMDTFDRDDFVKVKGLLQVYQNRSQFTVHRLRRLEDHEVDLADYFPCSDRDPEQMFAELQAIIADFENPHLRNLLQEIFRDPQIAAKYKMAPAAKNIHHACRGGLLEHVLSLCALSRLTATHYKTLDVELLLAGAILHDIGKVEELSYSRSFGYSAEGQLLGHIIIGLRIVGSKFDHVPGFPPKLRTLIEHMIISHHGELEFGSPKVPAFAEALLLHHLDNLDSKMDAVRGALKRDHYVESEFTGWVAPLERILLRKERFLREQEAMRRAEPEPKPLPTPAVPGTPLPKPIPDQPPVPPASKPVPMTLFGEKLQAVLETRK
ncbi:MAG: HDIG domain-containing protein [Acidobacteriaceae bacterium]|nr:HDIG domain-containing protein [Acidobacteriaceae bacterium]